MMKMEQVLFKTYFYGYILKDVPGSWRGGGWRPESSLVIFLATEIWGKNSSEEKTIQNDINQRCRCPVPMEGVHRALKVCFSPSLSR